MKTALVCGAGGFIGSHLIRRLKKEGYFVVAASSDYPKYSRSVADRYFLSDLTNSNFFNSVVNGKFDEIYQLAAKVGGANYVFSGKHDADMYDSTEINILTCKIAVNCGAKVFFPSSACVYPNTIFDTKEEDAYPAMPNSEYGWEKLISERLYSAYHENYGLDVRIARLNNIFGEESAYEGDKAQGVMVFCRKIAELKDGDEIEIWGDGEQTRSFLYIDECIEGIRRLMESDYTSPVNLGSSKMISINNLVKLIAEIAGKKIKIKHITGNIGTKGRNSNNKLILEKLGWQPTEDIRIGLEKTYNWVLNECNNRNTKLQ